MGNEQKIIDKILADANAENVKILESANEYAQKIIDSAQEKADKELESCRELAQTEAEKAAAKEISGAEMEAKKIVLQTKQQCLENTIVAAKEKLLALNGKEYEETILNMLSSAHQGDEVIFSEKDKKSLAKLVEEKGWTVSSETRPINGGFIVKKGEIEYNYSFESIIAVEKEEIEQIAAEILFA